MKYSTGQKKRSRLQGHRKRRRTFEVAGKKGDHMLSWMEYKTVRQYQSMGDMLDEFKMYGYSSRGVHRAFLCMSFPGSDNAMG